MSKKIDQKILMCPHCASETFISSTEKLQCCVCSKVYDVVKNNIIFESYSPVTIKDPIDNIKYHFKKYYKLYDFLVFLISPIYTRRGPLKKFLAEYVGNKESVIALNLGSGNSNLSKNISNVDIFPYDNVNLTCDINRLPLKSETVDVIINIAVLEHIPEPEKSVDEMYRVLKKGGVMYCFFPFMVGYHASPCDFQRRTIDGLKVLFKKFEILDIQNGSGPTSSLLWIAQEYLSLLFSLGIGPLYRIILFLMMVLTFPVKFLDIVLIHNPMAKNISPGYIVIGKK